MRHPLCGDFPGAGRGSHGSVTGRVPGELRGAPLPTPASSPTTARPNARRPPNLRHCERSEAIQGVGRDSGLLPPSPDGLRRTRRSARNDARGEIATQTPKQRAEKASQDSSLPRRDPRPSDARHLTLLERRAQGRPGAGRRPWSACSKKARGRTTGSAEITRPSLRDGVTIYTRSSRGPACWPRRGRHVIAHLASAPGCQNHATSSSHRDRSSARASPRCVPMRPPHPAPDVRDDREAPPQRDGMRGVEHDFG